MGFFSRFSNPSWSSLAQLQGPLRQDVANLLIMPFGLRPLVRVELLEPFCALLSDPNIHLRNYDSRSNLKLSRRLSDRLVDEALLALMKCQSTDGLKYVLNAISDHNRVPQAICGLILAGLNDAGQPGDLRKLSELPYSRDAEEAFAQLVDAWRRLLGIADVRLIGIASVALELSWRTLNDSLLTGAISGCNRGDIVSRDKRAKDICAQLTTRQHDVVKQMITWSVECARTPSGGPPLEVVLRGKDGTTRAIVKWDSDGRATITSQKNGSACLLMAMAAVNASTLCTDDWNVFSSWCGLRLGPPTDRHYEEFVTCFVNWLAGNSESNQHQNKALKDVAGLVAKDPNLPELLRPVSPSVAALFVRMYSKDTSLSQAHA